MTDVRRGTWLLDRVGSWGRVGGAAGTGFEAYARILHPASAVRFDLSVTDEHGMPPVLEETRWSWAEVAARQGLAMHALVQWNRLTDPDGNTEYADGWQLGQTQEGYFDLDLLSVLTQHLAGATTAPDDLVAALWDGWGELSEGGAVRYVEEGSGPGGWLARGRARLKARAAHRELLAPAVRRAAAHGPKLAWPEREMLLFATSVDELADPTWPERAGIGVVPGAQGLSPQLIWPADRSWVVASEIDWDSTIVAGSRALVEDVLADKRFEAFEVGEDADLTYEGDTINPPRDGWSAAP